MANDRVASSWLSKYSVRWQLTCLIFIPLLILVLAMGQLVLLFAQDLETLNRLEQRYAFYEQADQAVAQWGYVREDLVKQTNQKELDLRFVGANESIATLNQHSDWRRDLLSSFQELSEFEREDLESEEWIELIDDAFATYIQKIASYEIASSETSLSQLNHQFVLLRELLELVDLEYLSYAISVQEKSQPDISRIQSLVLLQQGVIDAYIQRYASEEQISALLEAFSHPSFEKATELRENLFSQNAQLSENDLVIVQQRREQVIGVAQTVREQVTSEIERISSELKSNILLNAVLLILGLAIAALFAMKVAKRFTSSLSFIGGTLEKIEHSHDYSLSLEIPGADEFSSLSLKLVDLMKEREASERAILESKEEAERANRAKSAFLANMSHEIRTPLNGILGMANILEKTKLDPSQRNHLSTVQSSSKVLLNLINDVLDLSKIESGGLNISPSESLLHSVFEDAASIITPRAHEGHVSFEMDYALDIPDVLFFDEYRTAQVVLNLLSNAVKFSPEGQVLVRVYSEPNYELSEDEQHWDIYVQVQDSGIGMSPEQQKSLFTPFKQADDSITRRFQGTGLGLALSKNLAELMGGRIEVESVLGEGSTFTFVFPAKEVNHKAPMDQLKGITVSLIGAAGQSFDLTEKVLKAYGAVILSEVDPQADGLIYQASETDTNADLPKEIFIDSRPDILLFPAKNSLKPVEFPNLHIEHYFQLPVRGRKLAEFIQDAIRPAQNDDVVSNAHNMRVLVVEDDKINQTVAEVTLQTEGFDVTLADNGEEGFKTFQEQEFDVILMDCMMPVMDGFDATKNIRIFEEEQGRKATPIIALTASVLNDDIDKCFEAGMDAYVHKPFEVKNLIGQIMRVTGKGEEES